MKKPPQELIDAFYKWYSAHSHSQTEDFYDQTITKNYLSGLSKSDFIDFFYQFAHEGGKVQSGGHRTSGRFRQTIVDHYDQFRSFVLKPFDSNFDVGKWLSEIKAFNSFGIGLATIYLNRVDKKRFPILNNKATDSLALFDISLPSDRVKRYKAVLEAQQQLINWFPQFDNFYRVDALNQFLIGEEEGLPWKQMLANDGTDEYDSRYWVFQGNPNNYDVIGSLRDGVLKTWQVNQHKKEIKTGDRVVIWLTGENSGCFGLATVMSDVQLSAEDPKEASFWIKPTDKSVSERVTIRIDSNLWAAPLLKSELDNLPGFSEFPAGSQGTNLKITGTHFKSIQDLLIGREQIHYWIYAPGRDAKFWDECWMKGIMVLGGDELVDLQTYKNKDAIEKTLKKTSGLKRRPKNDALAAWEFSRVVKLGDIIIAKKGRQQYIGYGIVTGPYVYDASRDTYRNVRAVRWVKKGEWKEDSGPIVLKTLTDITKYSEYVDKLKKLIGIEDGVPSGNTAIPALNTILYGPPGTGKTHALRNKYMKKFTDSQIMTRDQFAQELAGELTWLDVITIALYDLGKAITSDIFDHPLFQAKIRLSSNQSPKNTIWASLQRHTKIDCPNVKYAQRDEPLIFFKDEKSVWTVDRDMVNAQLPELIEKLKILREFEPISKEIKRFEYITFHQSYCYEDFVEGIKPVMSKEVAETLNYEVKPGIFRRMVKRALDDPDHDYALLIDEINRGNVASIFGELISLIEEDKRKGKQNELTAQLPYSREDFVVPGNLYIIGAMNTADRSVEALDTALRRRFTFISFPPRPESIDQPVNPEVNLQQLLITINARIEKLLDKDHCIGHSYFMSIYQANDPIEELRKIFATKILPLLEEYFYGDPAKIGMVLGAQFVTRDDKTIEWAVGDWGVDEFEERRIYTLQDPTTIKAEDFRAVYE
jgi:hypothetical protein